MNTPATKNKTFRSRVGILLVLFIAAALSPAIVSAIRRGAGHPGVYIVGGLIISVVLTLAGIRYVISGDKLIVKMWGMSMGNVHIADIRSIRRSYNPLSSPAGSLKRLAVSVRIRGGAKYDTMLISPAGEKRFLEELKAINPRIEIAVPEKKTWRRPQDWDF